LYQLKANGVVRPMNIGRKCEGTVFGGFYKQNMSGDLFVIMMTRDDDDDDDDDGAPVTRHFGACLDTYS